MKKIYQIVFIALVSFLLLGQNLVFGQTDIQKAISGKIVCIQANSNTNDKEQIKDPTQKENSKIKLDTKNAAPVCGTLTIRCTGSTLPQSLLYIIDGIPYSEDDEVVTNFSPDGIESITVLKAEAATALYNCKGVNGVVIITTKKNKKAKEEKVEKQPEEIALNVFPNPSSEFVTIDLNLKEESKVKITIHNLQTFESHTITEKKFEAGKQTIKYDLEKLEEGTYNIKIQIGKQVLHRKLIIEK